MNHLAHLQLSGGIPLVMVGNLISDTVKGKQWAQFHPELAKGMLLHREIDFFTDNHPLMQRMAARNRPFSGKAAGAVTDVLCDFLLCENWQHYDATPLEDFISYAYEVLADHCENLPTPWPTRLKGLFGLDWLQQYRSRHGMERIFEGFTQRLKLPVDVDGLFHHFFELDFDQNMADFRLFYSDLTQEIARLEALEGGVVALYHRR